MIRLLYLASPSYSGSTLLTLMLNESPGIATVGELKWGDIDLDSYRCSCEALLKECPFWQAVASEVEARGLPFPLARPPTDFRCREARLADRITRTRVRGAVFEAARTALLWTLPAGRRCRDVAAAVNRAAIEAIMKLQGGEVFLDASKDPVRLHHLAQSGDYDIRVVQLIRDGRGVVNSALKHAGGDARSAALEWRRTHAQIERVAQRLGADRLLPVHYEDLCRDPAGTIERVCAFADVPPPRPGAPRAEHHVLGNAMRLRPLAEVKPDESWRAALSRPAAGAFNAVAGRINAGYGYV